MKSFSRIELDINQTEKDIFNLVFFPGRITEDKTKILRSGQYDGIIGFYEELRKCLFTVTISTQIKLKLAKSIPIYNTSKEK